MALTFINGCTKSCRSPFALIKASCTSADLRLPLMAGNQQVSR